MLNQNTGDLARPNPFFHTLDGTGAEVVDSSSAYAPGASTVPTASMRAASPAAAPVPGEWPRARPWLLELALVVSVSVLALALRLPNYELMPSFTDEVDEVYRSLLVARGELSTPINVSAYLGSFWNYLVASALWIGDFNAFAPRILVLTIGVLTVAATYPLGRAWGGPAGGLIAALLLTASPEHIVINSHVAWSNCITPLFSTLAVWMLYEAVRLARDSAPSLGLPNPPAPFPARGGGANPPSLAGKGGWGVRLKGRAGGPVRAGLFLALSGLCWGLAFQTHPTVLALMPGAAVFLAWKGRPLLRTRWPVLAAGLFLLVNLNLVIYNLTNGFGSIAEGLVRSSSYSRGEQLTPAVYTGRLTPLALGLFRDIGGAVDQRQVGKAQEFLLDPGIWPVASLAALGLLWQWRRDNALPFLLLVSTALVLPLFSRRFESVQAGRYLSPLLPVLFAGIGAFLSPGLDAARSVRARRRSKFAHAQYRPVGIGLLALFLILHPFLYLRTYYQQEPRLGGTNTPYFLFLEHIQANQEGRTPVIIDRSLHRGSVGRGGALLSNIFQLLLGLQNVPSQQIELESAETADLVGSCTSQLVLLDVRRPEMSGQIAARLGLIDLDEGRGPPAGQNVGVGLYRLERPPRSVPGC